MSYHKDPEVNRAIIELLDALCQWERGSGRRSTLILIPHSIDERIIIAEDGKPLQKVSYAETENLYRIISMALLARGL